MQKPAGFSAFLRNSRQLAATYLIIFLAGLLVFPSIAGFGYPQQEQQEPIAYANVQAGVLFLEISDGTAYSETSITLANNDSKRQMVAPMSAQNKFSVAVSNDITSFPKISVIESPDNILQISISRPTVWRNQRYVRSENGSGAAAVLNRYSQTDNLKELSGILPGLLVSDGEEFPNIRNTAYSKTSVMVSKTVILLC